MSLLSQSGEPRLVPVDQPVLRDAKLLLRGKNYAGVGDWLDESGNNNHGVITDAKFDAARGAFHFDSSTDVVDVTHNTDLDLATSETLTVVVVLEYTSTTGFQAVVSKQESIAAAYPGYTIEHHTAGYVTGFVADGTNSATISDLGSGVITTGEVYAVAVSIDLGTADLIRGYWEGNQVYNGVSTSNIANPGNTQNFTIGQSGAGNDPFSGYVYAVAFWDRILSHWEIAAATVALRPFNQVLPLWVPYVTYQYAYPASDISSTDWDTAPTASQSLYAQLDEEVRSDTDYIFYSP